MSTPFVARSAQVARLTEALGRARAGTPSLVLLGADAGVGKTRLVREVAERAGADGARVVTGHCVDLGEIGLPYLPFAEALGALHALDPDAVRAVAAARPALARLAGPGTVAPPGDDAADRLQLFEGVVEALAASASPDRPLLLVLEDMHWADASSRDLLRFLVSRLAGQHLLVVVTYRTDDLHRRHPWRPVAAELARHPRSERLLLDPFTEDELRDFTAAVAGAPLPDPLLRRVRERAEGNAYFTEELLEAGADSDALPWTLGDVLRTRVEQLEPAPLRLVQLASAAGRRVDEPLLRAAAGADGDPALAAPGAVERALRDAVAQHVLVVEDGRIAFRHALLAEAVYTDLLPGELGGVHRAYLRALDAEPGVGTAAQRAAHAVRAPDLPVALRASWDAAVQAHRVLAPTEELRHLEVVLRLWDAAPEVAAALPEHRAGVLLRAAGAASRAGAADRAVQLARSALEAPDTPPGERPAVRTMVARHLLGVDDVPTALDEAARAVAELPDAPTPARAWALATYARAAVNAGREDEAEQLAGRAVEIAREVGDAAAESDAMATLALAERLDHAQSARLLAEALERAVGAEDRATELRIRYNLASAHYDVGDLPRAAQASATGVARARALGMSWAPHGVDLHALDAMIRFARGDLSPRAPGPDDDGDVPEFAAALVAAGDLWAAVARGDDDAVGRAQALERWWDRDPLVALLAGGNAVDALTWQGRPAQARELLDRVDAHLRSVWPQMYTGGIRMSALALAATADEAAVRRLAGAAVDDLLADADARLDRAERTAQARRPRPGGMGPEGRAWLARARAEHARARSEAAPALWASTVAEFGYGHAYEEARSRWRWAEALLVAGDRAAATTQAASALAAAQGMGARPLAEAVRDLVRRGRLDVAGVRAQGVDVLTAREAEVLALVAQGLSNRQIGERLFISGKTVSVHVSNVLGKLGASGRTEAVTVAHRRGLLTPRA
ncbi:helix-turn-helix transcriptional regulator [Cellulomonas shaoxiangyii]|uniref:Helix-turn-helix transcriptional regulator n=2 Tax=Cellulomonas shaoxiangyii TaxID=2566013 RepID=A0A4V1CN74_9CELL|nr:helix-turn-helix transcriptional regulator [Cellulomonas shaoxiangyii]TGY77599.1 helix-turn-helix transcriptional regulator [Cellulomonas shaoxiangyii]